MKRRLVLLGLFTVTACATTPEPANAPAHAQTLPLPGTPAATAPAAGFDAWLAGFRQRAVAAGISRATLDRELSGLAPAPQVARLDSSQPEFSKPVSVYVQEAVTPSAVAEGARLRAGAPWLAEVERRYGVPGGILVGIWGRETGYGKILGTSDVVQALATRIANGKTRFEPDLIAALRLIDRGELTRAELKGSWAGAFGQTQFMPTNIEAFAVDADGDRKRDLRGSSRDALTSAANYLQQKGWRRGQDWTREVILPARFDYGVAEEEKRPLTWWAAQGVRRADGRPWSNPDAEARLLLPAGAGGPAFLAFDNYDVILTYNRSMAYALAVGLLADGAEGRGRLVRAWPSESPLPRSEIVAAQATLRALGFDPGAVDGQVGADTRRAVRAWQRARGRPADGYLSAATVAALRQDTGRSG
jgi:membrane-bound lytic murein transglycosylase B